MKKGFSLTEVLISVIVISLLSVSMVPVLTKHFNTIKISDKINFTKCANNIDPACKLCYNKTKCVVCAQKCNSNEYLNKEECKCYSCSSKFGDACTKCNTTYCRECKEGFGYNSSNGTCSECNKGYFSADRDNKACKPCGQNQYQDSTKATGCNACQANSSTNGAVGVTSIAGCKCNAGYYRSGNVCYQCSAGHFCPGDEQQHNCPTNATSPAGSSSINNCYCPANYYGTPSSGGNCNSCPSGSSSPAYSTSINQCACAAGYYLSAYGCTQCPSGSTSNSGATSINQCYCLAGYYRNASGNCQICDVGHFCPGNEQIEGCSAGQFASGGASSCGTCNCGYFSAAGAGSCIPCPAGSVATLAGSSGCTHCPGTQYQSAQGQCGCVDCPSGSYVNTAHTSCTACSSTFANCNTCTHAGCTGCNSGYKAINGSCYKEVSPDANNCKSIGANYLKANKACVMTSAPSSSKVPIPTGITTQAQNKTCPKGTNDCCWTGISLGIADSVLCTHSAATKICANISAGHVKGSWKLPSDNEMKKWTLNDAKTINLCGDKIDNPNNNQTRICNAGEIGKSCLHGDKSDNFCIPRFVWSSTAFHCLNWYHGTNGYTYPSDHYNEASYTPATVRCILTKNFYI